MYAVRMLSERFQILLTAEQRRRLETEARRRGISLGALVREAVDRYLGTPAPAERQRAVAEIRRLRGRFVPPEQLERLLERERLLEQDPTGAAAPA